ncbi:lipoprotein LpqH [Mycolicibacterium fluoranthenivorans]|uniref:Lipoprotein LpqH n=1 Tax=Mycolicibacterium fluoranthenivorans TaxID=258505 RepID=A0A7G8PIN9_9MYCO|nr:lipoprotein LpqH [Mycolicibacterium fluoranthenivorans]QNJ94205.1 lipoprotein LpqH [Mycolicibacterium fluoranthenivorans]
MRTRPALAFLTSGAVLLAAGCAPQPAPAPTSTTPPPPAAPPPPVLATALPAGQAQLIVNGRDVGPIGPVVCSAADGFARYTIGQTSFGVTVVITDDDMPSVRSVTIGDAGGISIGYAADVSEDAPQAFRHGDTLTVTGRGAGTDSTNPARVVPTTYQLAVACP